ncbi:hypothetical protein BH10ACT9_BH10ACT9_31200 [soil metagenome]
MEISLRSYLTAGISLTAASAIAFTPLVLPANEKALTIPHVSVSEIQLTVTPAEIVAFFDNLQGELEAFNADLADVVGIPGQSLFDALQLAIDANTDFYATLAGLTTNPTLLGLLAALEDSSNYGLESLQIAVGEGNDNIMVTTEDLANLLDSTITGSLSNVLSSFVAVLNDPFSAANYAGLLSTGLVATGQLVATNGLSALQVLGDSGFGFAFTGLDLAEDQIFNAITTVADLMDVGADATGSAVIEAVNAAIQSLTLGPIQALSDVGFGVTGDVLGGFQDGLDTTLAGLGDIVTTVGGSLQSAINTIGAGPLTPANYLAASAILLAGGFTTFNTGVQTVGDVAQIPFAVGISITTGVTNVATDLNLQFATALSGVLAAAGLPADIAGLPVALATQANNLIDAGAGAVIDGLDLGGTLVDNSTQAIIAVSNDIEAAIFGVLPTGGAGAAATLAAPVETAALKSGPSGPSSGAAVVDDDDAADEDAPAGEAPAEEAPAAEAPAEEAPAQDDAPAADATSEDDSDASEAKADKSEARAERAEKREAKKAEREAKKAEREAKKAEKADSSDSAASSDSGSDSSDSE